MGWTKRDRSNHTDLVRVRVFIDHLKFSRSWQIAHSGLVKRKLEKEDIENAQFESQEIRWDLLPQAIIDYLDEIKNYDPSMYTPLFQLKMMLEKTYLKNGLRNL